VPRRGEAIVDKQFALQRVADVAVDLFVGLCIIARVSSMADDDSEQYRQALSIAHSFIQQAKRRMNRSLRAMLRNAYERNKSLAEYVCSVQGLPLGH
jgi:acyl-CoA dehydrogenase family protein 9